MGSESNGKVILETRHVVKQFPKVLANDDISIILKEGEILSLLGENGAGKSTLMNVLYGLYQPTSGEMLLDGKRVQFDSPKDAIRLGLGMVHQHFMLVETLTVTENIILGAEPGNGAVIDYRKARQEVSALSEKYGLKVDPDAKIETLSVGLQQRVEILKALYRKAKILILDEPTAVLTPQEVEELFDVIKELRKGGVSLIIITHKLEEVMEISDRVYILRRGKIEGERATKECTKEELANLMVGRSVVLTVEKKPKAPGSEDVFRIENLKVLNDKEFPAVNDLSLHVRPGEVVGIAGVDGNGQTELAEAIMGLRPVADGRIFHHGDDITGMSTKALIGRSISYVPADRQRFGLVLPMTVSENIAIGYHDRVPNVRGINLNFRAMDEYATELVERFDIRPPAVDVKAGNLSGGNQQKVILAREFSRKPTFLLVSQPTRGLDVGAIEYIHNQILAMRDQNVAILLISLELEEIFSLSDRIIVLYEGKVVKELSPEKTTEKQVGFYMTGGKE
ncbi:ABC transporter ATP-binding protein [Sediminispirochaeta smaragdinae]|jgi:simple sugar transport system ATP-binding protein|uniref:ABC transporter related protein n=1 Tax=Sediminispirochaeta smaragdinae (strain DSM 11293 / JCM 15392 / SEBR 4228) TaxID=573413 RepID=E1R9Q4_SEDSS|nr:ABC transporter ATP-binding protein [Sediminispirochaeta smaragdinae]ADK83223.1 ABC transporter related protein [Sediminispirochaeta smaragdinae DSM 11293]